MAAFISMFARSIPYITQAIYAGHTASVMLNHFSRSSKRIQEQILSARSSGYDDSQILTHMIKAGESAHMKALKGAGHKTKRDRDESFTKAASLAKKALGAAGLAAAAYGGYKYANRAVRPSEILPAQGAQGGQQRQLTGPGGGQLPAPRQPPQLPNLPPSIPPQGQVITPPYSGPPGAAPFSKLNVNPAAGQTPGRAVSQQVTQPTPRAIIPPVPQARQQPQDKLGELESLLGSMGAQSQGQIPVPEAQMLPPEAKPYGKSQVPQAPTVGDATPEFDAWIERFKQPEEPMYPPVVKDIMPQPLSKENPPPKNDLVETANGEIGTIKSISGNKALIDVNGKMQPVEISSLKGQPDAIKKAKFVFDPSLIPESTKSAALAQVIPLPSNEGVVVRFHGSNPYMYHRKDGSPIPNDIIRSLIDGTEIPMTSGNTFLGNWDATVGDSRGSSNFKNLKNMAQSPEEAQSNPDPNKPLIFEELKDNFLHGLYKDFESSMIEVDKAFKSKKKEPEANGKKSTQPAKPVKKTVSNNLSKVSDDKNQQPPKENKKVKPVTKYLIKTEPDKERAKGSFNDIINDEKGNFIAELNYDIEPNNTIFISGIDVDPSNRRSGYATKLLLNLIDNHPNKEIVLSPLQPDGAKLFNILFNKDFSPQLDDDSFKIKDANQTPNKLTLSDINKFLLMNGKIPPQKSSSKSTQPAKPSFT